MGNILQTTNVHIGDNLIGSNISNIDGHFEDIALVELNDEALSALGHTWDSPPSDFGGTHKLSDEVLEKFKLYAACRSEKNATWAAKDPRLSLTIPALHPHLSNPHYIVCYRDSEAVAKSLYKRDGMPLEKGKALKTIYDAAIESFFAENTHLKRFNIDYNILMKNPEQLLRDLFLYLQIETSEALLASACEKVSSPQALKKKKEQHLLARRNTHLKKLISRPYKVFSSSFWKKLMVLHTDYKKVQKTSQ